MQVTEVLLFGFHQGTPVCTIDLEQGIARVALTIPGYDGEKVTATWEDATQAFTGIRDVVHELTAR